LKTGSGRAGHGLGSGVLSFSSFGFSWHFVITNSSLSDSNSL
jgi:hypothetical protein